MSGESRISVTSEVEGFSLDVDNNDLINLEKYLETIHFWDEGVVYGKVRIEGTAKLKKLNIVFTPLWRDQLKTYSNNKEQPFSTNIRYISSWFNLEMPTRIHLWSEAVHR